MSDRQEEKLDKMLRSRRLEAANPELTDRIILRAAGMPQNQTATLGRWIRQLFAEFHLARPAYVLAATLILGFVVGFNTPVETARDGASVLQVQTFLDADEDVL